MCLSSRDAEPQRSTKVEAVYPMAFETFEDFIASLPRFIASPVCC